MASIKFKNSNGAFEKIPMLIHVDVNAENINIEDINNNFTATNVEGALNELASIKTLEIKTSSFMSKDSDGNYLNYILTAPCLIDIFNVIDWETCTVKKPIVLYEDTISYLAGTLPYQIYQIDDYFISFIILTHLNIFTLRIYYDENGICEYIEPYSKSIGTAKSNTAGLVQPDNVTTTVDFDTGVISAILPESLPANGGNADTLGKQLPSYYAKQSDMASKADLVEGKVPVGQLPEMNYSPVGHKHSKAEITDFPSIPSPVQVVDNLVTASPTSALSAYQGKVLNDKINNDVANVFQTGDLRRSTRDLTSLGYIKSSSRVVNMSTYPALSNVVKGYYGLSTSAFTFRAFPNPDHSVTRPGLMRANTRLYFFSNKYSSNLKLYMSTDYGVSFTELTIPSYFLNSSINSDYTKISYVNGRYFMYTSHGYEIYSSTDGVTFTKFSDSPVRVSGFDYFKGNYILCGSGASVAGFYYSSTGTSWTMSLNTTSDWVTSSSSYSLPTLCVGRNRVITPWIYNYKNYYYYSDTGVSWVKYSPQNTSIDSQDYKIATVWADGLNMFISGRGISTYIDSISSYVTWSSDGLNWNPCTQLYALVGYDGTRTPGSQNSYYGIYYDETSNVVIAYNDSNTNWTSTPRYFMSYNGKDFQSVLVPSIGGLTTTGISDIKTLNGKTCIIFVYKDSSSNTYYAIGTSNFTGADQFLLPYSNKLDLWIKG